MSSALSSYIRNLSIDNTVITSVSFDGLANSNDINIEYKDNDKTIWLSSGNGHVTSVDCTDFIKDGMLSSAELCGTILILNFNTDAGSDPISIELSNFVDDYDDRIKYLSDYISANTENLKIKISINNAISGFTDWKCDEITDGWTYISCEWKTEPLIGTGWFVTCERKSDMSPILYGTYVAGTQNDVVIQRSISDPPELNFKLSRVQLPTMADLSGKASLDDLSSYEPISSLYNDVSSIVLSSAESKWIITNQTDWSFDVQPYYIGNNKWKANFQRGGDFGVCYADGDENATSLHFDDEIEIDVYAEKCDGRNTLGIVTYDYLSSNMSNYLDKRTGGEVSGDVKILSSNFIQTNDIENTYIYSRSPTFMQVEYLNGYRKPSSGTCGYALLGIISSNQIKLSSANGGADLSDLTAWITEDYSPLWSISLTGGMIPQYFNIVSVDGQIVTLDKELKDIYNTGNTNEYRWYRLSSQSEDYFTSIVGIPNNAFYCVDMISAGNMIMPSGITHNEGAINATVQSWTHAEGCDNIAEGRYSHAEGYMNKALGVAAHAEGLGTIAEGPRCHAEGSQTFAGYGYGAHAEGHQTSAYLYASHAEGYYTLASGKYSHAEGVSTSALGQISHAEGSKTNAGEYSHAEGHQTIASATQAHAEGAYTSATGNQAHAENYYTLASGKGAHAEGYQTSATGNYSHAEGEGTYAFGSRSHTEGVQTSAIGNYSHAEGQYTSAQSISALNCYNVLSTGIITSTSLKINVPLSDFNYNIGDIITITANGNEYFNCSKILSKKSIASQPKACLISVDQLPINSTNATFKVYCGTKPEVGIATVYTNATSHAEGHRSTASEMFAHAEGVGTTAAGKYSHVEGFASQTTGAGSHAEGFQTSANGVFSHATGIYSNANDDYSWCWNGLSSTPYASKGEGTFCINPLSGLSGFYIGEQNLEEIISARAGGLVQNTIKDALTDLGITKNTLSSDIDVGQVYQFITKLATALL